MLKSHKHYMILVAVAVLFIFCSYARTHADPSPMIVPEIIERGSVGGEAKVAIKANESVDLSAWHIILHYTDPNAISFKDVTYGESFPEGTNTYLAAYENVLGEVNIAGISLVTQTGTGTICYVYFNVLAESPKGMHIHLVFMDDVGNSFRGLSTQDTALIPLTLPAGWSMVSLPVDPNDARISAIFPDAVVMYMYDPNTGYVRLEGTDALEVGRGYWLLLKEAKTYFISGEPIEKYIRTVSEGGWQMIGGCSTPAKPSADSCSIRVIYHYVPGSGYRRVLSAENLEPGKGYWILLQNVTGSCDLTVESTGE